MGIYSRVRSYPKRAWVAASFLAVALVLGGGEAKSPAAELVVQLCFAVAAIVWIWISDYAPLTREQRFSLLVPLAILAVPAIQLVPLPPSIWHSLPGREPEIAALRLVGAAEAWRPISEVPLRTLSTLLSMVPPLGVFYAVSRLEPRDRTLIPCAILAIALATAVLGGLQVAAKDGSLTLYSQIHAGWVTGFQSNRNHAADLLLAGLLSLALLYKRAVAFKPRRTADKGSSGNRTAIALGFALLLFAALVMTASRSGIALGLIALLAGAGILAYPARQGERFPVRAFMIASIVIIGVAVIGSLTLTGEDTTLSRVAARFADLRSERSKIWADAVYAWQQFWPVGIGAGGFMAAMFPAERLEFLNATYPNQAHNDFLEIGIEAGIGGYLALAGVLLGMTALAVRGRISTRQIEVRTQMLFAATVLILLILHSVVDYPLRSMSLACLAGAAGGMLVLSGRNGPIGQSHAKVH